MAGDRVSVDQCASGADDSLPAFTDLQRKDGRYGVDRSRMARQHRSPDTPTRVREGRTSGAASGSACPAAPDRRFAPAAEDLVPCVRVGSGLLAGVVAGALGACGWEPTIRSGAAADQGQPGG